ncbi:MAG TPA: hypothetical protein VNE39_27895, partial [Planctomycetota bacterium]|nr:hypothetical protein [Planctomycetota bacterium]
WVAGGFSRRTLAPEWPEVPKGRQKEIPDRLATGFCRPLGTGPQAPPHPAAEAAGNPLQSLRD